MAKYGIDTFNRRFDVSQDVVYGALTFTGVEVSERFRYVNSDTGAVYATREEAPYSERAALRAENTHEIDAKYLLAYSSKQKDNMDIKIPTDFDESTLSYGEKLKVKGLVLVPFVAEREVEVNGNTRRVDRIAFAAQVEGVEGIEGMNPKSQPAKGKAHTEQP
jgi:hypothetical protein